MGDQSVARGVDIVQAVAALSVGQTVDVTFLRDGHERMTRATLAKVPSQDEMLRMDLVGSPAPAWKGLDTVSGSFPANIGAMRGKVVLLDFWATWCSPCRAVIPRLDALQARYGAQGLNVLGVSTEDTEDIGLFVQRMSIHYGMASDRRAETTRSYGVVSLPTLVVIDKRGVVRDVDVGYDPQEEARLDATVRSLLAEPLAN